MRTRLPRAQTYASAFVVRRHMQDFLVDLGERRGWTLLANLLRIRFDGAFGTFLDAPNEHNHTAIIGFEAEMVRVGGLMKGNMPKRR
jgi:hypothetical protein